MVEVKRIARLFFPFRSLELPFESFAFAATTIAFVGVVVVVVVVVVMRNTRARAEGSLTLSLVRIFFLFSEKKRLTFFSACVHMRTKANVKKERMVMRGDAETRSTSSQMVTRGQKRRMAQRDLWDLIVNNDDISFKHILPRLERNDIKFLYDVNTETKALIKRAITSGITLEDRFKIEEMSSISTLEFAWNNMDWEAKDKDGNVMNQAWFCCRVALTNKLELLKWIREEKECEWSCSTLTMAGSIGNLEMVKYCVANGCPVDEWTCAPACTYAAKYGHLECLKYLHEEVKAPWNSYTAAAAAQKGHLHILEYLVERKYDQFDDFACRRAAEKGHLDCLKFLHETAKAPWNERAVWAARHHNHSECLRYLLDNDCPLLPGWRYEHGILHTL